MISSIFFDDVVVRWADKIMCSLKCSKWKASRHDEAKENLLKPLRRSSVFRSRSLSAPRLSHVRKSPCSMHCANLIRPCSKIPRALFRSLVIASSLPSSCTCSSCTREARSSTSDSEQRTVTSAADTPSDDALARKRSLVSVWDRSALSLPDNRTYSRSPALIEAQYTWSVPSAIAMRNNEFLRPSDKIRASCTFVRGAGLDRFTRSAVSRKLSSSRFSAIARLISSSYSDHRTVSSCCVKHILAMRTSASTTAIPCSPMPSFFA